MGIAMRPEVLFLLVVLTIVYVLPIVTGFTWVRLDADRGGQPGILWALLTIPFGWLTILVYAVLRALRPTSPRP